MKRIDTSGAVAGQFRDGDDLTGIEGTILSADWLTNVQEELASVIEAAPIALDGTQHDQLLKALRSLLSGRIVGIPDVHHATFNWAPPASYQKIRVQMAAGGGGGGGVAAQSSTTAAAAAGGSAGGETEAWFTKAQIDAALVAGVIHRHAAGTGRGRRPRHRRRRRGGRHLRQPAECPGRAGRRGR